LGTELQGRATSRQDDHFSATPSITSQ